jgi:hypothetical protein
MWIRLLAIVLLVLGPLACRADEATERAAIAQAMQDAWQQSDFARLDALYRGWRDRGDRLPSGMLKAGRMFWALAPMLATGRPATTDPRYEDTLTAAEETLQAWQKQQPASSLAALALTQAYIAHGFFYRGTEADSAVPANNLKMFGEYIGLAAENLARPGLEHDPAWYFARITLAQFQSTPPEDKARLVDEATARYSGFYDLYFAAIGSLAPREGGSPEAFEWLANLGVDRTRGREGDALYARVYWSVGQRPDFADDLFGTTRANWPHVKAGFEDIVLRYPEPWNLNWYALFACQARDGETLKEAFSRLGGKVDPGLWNDPQQLERCRALAEEVR